MFVASLSDQPCGLAHYRPHPEAAPVNCISNVKAVVDAYGGAVRFGWHFVHRVWKEHGDYLVATHHAVWHNPDDLSLVDVTPFHPDQQHHPVTSGGDVLFLVDDNAEPYRTGDLVVPLPLRFYAAKADPALKAYVATLQREEFMSYNAEFGSTFG